MSPFIQAFNAVRDGLMDDRVKTGHRLALEQRARKICKIKRNSYLKKHLTEIQFMELKEPSVVSILYISLDGVQTKTTHYLFNWD